MRLIDADALREKSWGADTKVGYVQVVDVGDIDDAPTVDLYKHGKWEKHLLPLAYKCSACGTRQGAQAWKFNSKKYCPECGAKMDLE